MFEIIGIFIALLLIASPFIALLTALMLLGGVKVIFQYQRGVRFTLGKFTGLMNPGLNYVIPILQSARIIDTRIMTIDIPKQEVITKDNLPIYLNAVIYFKVADPAKAVLNVRDYYYAVAKYGQTSLRNVAGEATMDEIISNRDQIAVKLREILDEATNPWGIDVTALELQDIELPDDLKRVMAKQAEAEREKRGTIIRSEGEVQAAEMLVKAVKTLKSSPGALHIRTLETINKLSGDKSKTSIWVIPETLLAMIERMGA